MACNTPCRCILAILNAATLIIGIAVVILGALMTWSPGMIHHMLRNLLTPFLQTIAKGDDAGQISQLISRIMITTSPLGLVVFSVGCCVTVLSMFGLCGACCKAKCLLKLYAAIVGIVAVAVIMIVIIYFATKMKLGEYFGQLFSDSVRRYQSIEANTADSLLIGLLQPQRCMHDQVRTLYFLCITHQLQCCGFDNSTDFINMIKMDKYDGNQYDNLSYPIPCCKMDSLYKITGKNCPNEFNIENSNIGIGCHEPLKAAFLKYLDYVAYAFIALFAVLVLLISLAVSAMRSDNK
ncbi:unnamed protein product [Dicrocoelium dendriticum]|nr:unnamed protein product [Dicrocoelium dendriticum]